MFLEVRKNDITKQLAFIQFQKFRLPNYVNMALKTFQNWSF